MYIQFEYTIQQGDTITSIANGIDASAGVTDQQIMDFNNATTSDLSVGQIVNIPALNTSTQALAYTVQSGDTYFVIASNLAGCAGVTVDQIESVNPQVDPNGLQTGNTIQIPSTLTVPVGTLVPAENIGYWDWTWAESAPPTGVTIGLAFSGYSDPTDALSNSKATLNTLQGTKYITLGGGASPDGTTTAAYFSASILTSINDAITSGQCSAYEGIAYDVENGDSGLEDAFEESFQIAQSAGLKVLVSVSHSAPYGISDAQTLMTSFFNSSSIDYLSPQLYTNGNETSNDYDTSQGVTWDQYATAKAQIIPSIVSTSYYPDAEATFATYGVTTAGYIRWSAS